jgi:polar amino acid transport system substrate-binding protein
VTPPPTVVCTPAELALKTPGRLTLSTDNPAFSPWWGGDAKTQYPNEPAGGSPWSESEFSAEPYSGEGFEGALAYAVAADMGFSADKVDWLANTVFEQAFAPGAKPFDFHMAQIAITPERAQAITYSDSYFDSNQALLAIANNPITSATSIADLKSYRLGAAANTTSFAFLEDTIAPTTEPLNFPDNTATRQALEGNVIDGIIVDLSTAFYMRDAQITAPEGGKIVGQFGPPAEPDHVGYVFELGNPLVDCVNSALAQLKLDGTYQAILDTWINTGEDVPFLQ